MSEIIYFDSCVFLTWLKGEDEADTVAALFDDASKGKVKILTSTLAIAEVLNIQGFQFPIPKERREEVRALFLNEWIITKGVNRRLAEISQDLVWEYGIKPKDGIHVATALVYKVPVLYSYDKNLTNKKNLMTNIGNIQIIEPLPPLQRDLFNGKETNRKI